MKKIVLLSLLFVAIGMHAQSSVSVQKWGKRELLVALSELGKTVFTPQNTLQVFDTKNVLLLETNLEEGLALVPTDEQQSIDVISVNNLPEGNARIFTLKGELVKEQMVSAESPMDVNGLNAGVYILQVNNITLKLIKQ